MNATETPPELTAVITRFRSALRASIRKRVPNDAVADDLTQEVWVRIANASWTSFTDCPSHIAKRWR